MLKRWSPAVLAVLGLLAVVPLAVAEMYVPIIAEKGIGAVSYRTEIVVSNLGEEPALLSAALVEGDGRPGFFPRTVPAGGTFVFTHVTRAGKPGVLRLDSVSDLAVTARLKAIGRDGAVLSNSPVSVLSAEDFLGAGETAHLQGIERSSRGATPRLGIVNLSEEAASCWAASFRMDGSLAGEKEMTLAPGAGRLWTGDLDAFGGLFSEARVEVSCDAPFYAYAFVARAEGREASFIAPSRASGSGLDILADNALSVVPCTGGSIVPEPLPDGALGFTVPGMFLEVGPGDLCRAYDLPLQADTSYRQVRIEFDMQLDHFVTHWFHTVSSLRRVSSKRNERLLYYGLLLRGERRRTILDLGTHQALKQDGPWQEGGTYHVVMEFNGPSRRTSIQVFQGDQLIQQLAGRASARDIRPFRGRPVRVDFSAGGIAHHSYYPPTGWRFSDLRVEITR
ncbi:MAG TPA: hypothetical protein VF756_10185 [Thermoanaerobaculia bacterium]